MEPLQPTDPPQVGNYLLLGRLGGGGMGQVFLGRSPGGRPVAVKVVHAALAVDPDFRRRFGLEIEAARRVGGFYTAPVVDADPDGDPPWLVTAYVPGPSLHDAVVRSGPFAVDTVRSLGAGLAEGLAAIHACGLVHRDLKPANVILADDGPRVIDFGIARALGGSELTQTGAMVGTPGFMSPEQAMGEAEIGPPSDVFSLGSVLAFAASGQGPFGGGSVAGIVYRIVAGQADLTGVPAELRDLVEACLATDPARRPTLDELTAGLVGGHVSTDMFTAGWLPAAVPGLATVANEAATVVVPPHDRTRPETVPDARSAAPTERIPPPVAPTERISPSPGPGRRRFLLGAAGLVGAAAAGAGAWALLRDDGSGGAKTHGDSPGSTPPPGTVKWRVATAGTVLASPKPAGDLVYAASNDGTLYAFGAKDGGERWTFRTGAALGSAPAVVGGTVYLGSDDKNLYAVNAADGKQRWVFPTGGIVHSPAFAGGLVFAGSADGALYAVDADGRQRWRTVIGNDTHHAVVAGETVYVGSSDTNLYALDAASGAKKWVAPTGGAVSGFPVVDRGVVYFTSTDGVLYAVEAAAGKPLWKFAGVGAKAGPVSAGGSVYIGGGTKLFALDAGTGAQRAVFDAGGDVGAPTVAGAVAYVGSSDQFLYAVDTATMQARWKYQASGAVQTPATGVDAVYFGTADNTFTAVRL
ncbi:hypothetical protein GCM10023205_56690 [Yinghuangia aomiensis]|uniref:Protein kinase domain-containing protein n=1 Tax=Yinghuangia aomiensis TaxID=676205 RepID=A0ABP9HX12_9ACTN